jgi:hypothetical protein
VNEPPPPGPGAVAIGRAGLCFALLCLALSALAALGSQPDVGWFPLSRGFTPAALWRKEAQPPSNARRDLPRPAGVPASPRPNRQLVAPQSAHFFHAVY